MEPQAENWGGTRKGAGRPKADFVRLKDVTIPREVWAAFGQQAHREGLTPEALAQRVLEDYATAPLFAKI